MNEKCNKNQTKYLRKVYLKKDIVLLISRLFLLVVTQRKKHSSFAHIKVADK